MLRVLSAFAAVALALPAFAADPVSLEPPPSVLARPAPQNGIWGAIAYAPREDEDGMFWGGADRREAEDNALKHCRDAGGKSCRLVTVFRSLSLNKSPDDSGFPYHRCGALAIGETSGSDRWSAASADSRREAEAEALQRCGGDKQCRVREWVCT